MSKPAAFNAVAQKVKKDLQKYAKAIAVMNDLQDNWGPDSEGNKFTYEPFYSSLFDKTLLIATYGSEKSRAQHGGIRTLVVGLATDEPLRYDFTIYSGWCRNDAIDPQARMTQVIRGAGVIYNRKSEDADTAIADFVRTQMSTHPRFEQAVQETARKVTAAIKPVSPV